MIWVVLALRVWAVLTPGRSFSTFGQVDADQTVVTCGPYGWVRHPSYTGLLLITLGFGLAAGNWLSLANLRRHPAGGAVAPDRGQGGRAGPGTRRPVQQLPEGNTPPRTRAVVGSRRRLYGADGDRLGTAWRTEIPGALTALAQA